MQASLSPPAGAAVGAGGVWRRAERVAVPSTQEHAVGKTREGYGGRGAGHRAGTPIGNSTDPSQQFPNARLLDGLLRAAHNDANSCSIGPRFARDFSSLIAVCNSAFARCRSSFCTKTIAKWY